MLCGWSVTPQCWEYWAGCIGPADKGQEAQGLSCALSPNWISFDFWVLLQPCWISHLFSCIRMGCFNAVSYEPPAPLCYHIPQIVFPLHLLPQPARVSSPLPFCSCLNTPSVMAFLPISSALTVSGGPNANWLLPS